jgi:nucleotide-binding universal stress UspA family protein
MARLTGASLVIGCVQAGAPALPMNPGGVQPYAIAQPDADLLPDCTPALRRVESQLSMRGIKYDCVKLESTSAARALQEEAERDGAAMLVVGSSRRAGSRRVAAGSTGERLLHGAPCPVDVVPRDWTARATVSTIGVAWTDSEEAREALRAAWALARRVGAELRAFTVVRETLQMRMEAEPRIKEGQLGRDVIDVLGEHKLYALMKLEEEAAALGGEVPATRFALSLARKDADLVRAAAERHGAAVPVVDAVARQMGRAIDLGHGDEDMAATYWSSTRR